MFQTNYRHVEAALVQAYGIPEKAVGAFRGRLGNLQKKGLFGPKNMPGRGSALRYGPDQFHRLIFACELSEFGVGPATVLALIESLWERSLVQIFKKAERAAQHGLPGGPNDIVIHMGGVRLMSDAWSDAVPNVNFCTLSKLPDHIQAWMKGDRFPARALITNLSAKLRRFHTALIETDRIELIAERGNSKKRL